MVLRENSDKHSAVNYALHYYEAESFQVKIIISSSKPLELLQQTKLNFCLNVNSLVIVPLHLLKIQCIHISSVV